MKLVKEGWFWVLPPLSFAIFWHIYSLPTKYNPWVYFFVITFPSFLGIMLLASFFRDPNRIQPPNFDITSDILTPADGTICAIAQEENKLAIYIEMHLDNVHVVRSPVKAKVTRVQRIPGKHHMVHYFHFSNGKAIEKNAHAIITMEDDHGLVYQCFLICGAFFRRTVPYVKVGDDIQPGQRIGMIIFGSTVKILLPHTNYTLNVKPGQKVRGCASILCSPSSPAIKEQNKNQKVANK